MEGHNKEAVSHCEDLIKYGVRPTGGHLGTVRLTDDDNHIILVPTPSRDPNDPLNWSKAFRYYLAGLVCVAMVMCNFLAGGPSVAIEDTTIDLLGPPGPDMPAHIAKTSYLFTVTALMQGIGNLVWMPLIVKYGRRPVYLFSFCIYTATAIWAGTARTYGNALTARVVMGFASGVAETMAPLTISDTFFLHERGAVMACYTAALNFGASFGIVISSCIIINLHWRWIYYISACVIGALTILIFFTMPETSFNRNSALLRDCNRETSVPEKLTYTQRLRLYNGNLTDESYWAMFVRPPILLILPPVLWATLCMAATIGFVYGLSTNFATAYGEAYGFTAWQSGLCYISGLIGPAIGLYFGGSVSDWVAQIFTRRHSGIREPEYRLPAITIGLIASPVSLILYGVGIEHRLHWIVPTIGLGLLNFAVAQATNVSLVYIVDAYRPIAGEALVSQIGFKSAFGFLLSFYTNPWVELMGYQNAFGTMAAISAGVLMLWVPFFFHGKSLRHRSLEWPIIKRMILWNEDREVGE